MYPLIRLLSPVTSKASQLLADVEEWGECQDDGEEAGKGEGLESQGSTDVLHLCRSTKRVSATMRGVTKAGIRLTMSL